jgi:signal transduction histidine kinase
MRPGPPDASPAPDPVLPAAALSQGVMGVRDGCVVWANPTLVALAGRAEGLVGWKLEDLFEDAGRGLPRRGGRMVDCRLLRPGDESREVACRSIDGPPGEPQIWLVEDVTHVRRVERELLRTGRELSQAHRECEALRERLRSERAEREELLSVVSHELRTPVTVIGGYNRLLLAGDVGPLSEEQRRFLEESRKSCERLNHFIGNLIEASRADKGAHVLELGHGPLEPVIEGVATMFRPLLEERGIELRRTCGADACRARFDRLRLEQILTNLVGNAIKFGDRGGRIDIVTRPLAVADASGDPSRFVEIEISDDGPGVPSVDRDRIFEPYVQVADEHRGGGLGLGLAICKRLVEAHGGQIRLREREGGGSRFSFTLPASTDPVSPDAEYPSP